VTLKIFIGYFFGSTADSVDESRIRRRKCWGELRVRGFDFSHSPKTKALDARKKSRAIEVVPGLFSDFRRARVGSHRNSIIHGSVAMISIAISSRNENKKASLARTGEMKFAMTAAPQPGHDAWQLSQAKTSL
jgi:hypothetical protein